MFSINVKIMVIVFFGLLGATYSLYTACSIHHLIPHIAVIILFIIPRLTLNISDVAPEDGGSYRVKAKNQLGEVSANINLNFGGKIYK